MKLFRHPPLAFWTLACVVLIGALGAFAIVGARSTPIPPVGAAANTADGAQIVAQIRSRMIALPALSAAGGEPLVAWATDTAIIAADAAEGRYASHGPTDALAARLDLVAAGAADLAEAQGTVEIRAASTRLYTLVDSLVSVVHGIDPGPAAGLAPIESEPLDAPGNVDPDLTDPVLDHPNPAGPNPGDLNPGA